METHASGLEGKFMIGLRARGSAVVGVEIKSRHRFAVSTLLCGRRPSEAVRLLPQIYSLCGRAQGVAGLRACETALGIAVPRPHADARQFMTLAEAGGENARRILLDWPELFGFEPEIPGLVRLRRLLADCVDGLYPGGDWRDLGGGVLKPDRAALDDRLDQLDAIVAATLDGQETALAFRDVDGLEAFDLWLRIARSPVSRYLRCLCEAKLEALGEAETGRLGHADCEQIAQGQTEREMGSGAPAPEIDGGTRETGPIVRHWDHPLIADIRRVHRVGLLARLAARILDVALLGERLKALVPQIEETEPWAGDARDSGKGHAVVETARGWLLHAARIEGGSIRQYEILAPTDWNFHADGALARGLRTLIVRDKKSLSREAELCVTAVDPCTIYEIAVEGAIAA